MIIIICRRCKQEKKHKAKGLCKSCYDYRIRQGRRNYYRIFEKKYAIKTKIKKILDTPSPTTDKRKIKKGRLFNENEYRKKYRKKNLEVIRLMEKISYRRRVGLPCLEIRIKGKTRYFPFSGIDKPCVVRMESKEYQEYVKRSKEFDILKKWYEEKTK